MRFSTLDLTEISSSRPQECPREGDDAFGEELAGVAGAGFADHPLDKESSGKKLTAIKILTSIMQCSFKNKPSVDSESCNSLMCVGVSVFRNLTDQFQTHCHFPTGSLYKR